MTLAPGTTPFKLYSPGDWTDEDLQRFAREIDRDSPVDLGIVRAVKILRDAGFTTMESCQGGEGHSYPEPTIVFCGGPATGWKAIGELMTYGLPIRRFGEMWSMTYGHPTGPNWYVTFWRKV
jgi:hypothetical protein